MRIEGFQMTAVGAPLERAAREAPLGPGQVLVEVAGCGVCHTDLGFLDDGVPTNHALPLTLGHEISGVVRAVADDVRSRRVGDQVIVPAVMPCGDCALCRRGRGSICRDQKFPGNDIHGGFASHVVVPADGLCPVPALDGTGLTLAELSVVADAVTTPYQSIRRSGLREGDVAIVVGVGGVGGFAVQIAHALGAHVVAIDVDGDRLALASEHGAETTLDASASEPRAIKRAVRAFCEERGLPALEWKVFETSGTTAGQQLAFALLVHGAYLGVIGFTPEAATVRLSNLMAFDAVAEGNWGCLPELYPEALALILEGRVVVSPFVELHPLSTVNDCLERIRQHDIKRRVVLVPDLD